ncbi:Uncharacterised protein [Klebsiella pneumoniae]|nr:Uncharacterised protein [Klebsiella pneumoniae]
MGWWMNNQSRQALWLALAGSIVLMIGMGYGRFAFTGVLPLMLNGVLGIFRPKTTKCSGGPAVCGLQRGITFFEIPIWALFE